MLCKCDTGVCKRLYTKFEATIIYILAYKQDESDYLNLIHQLFLSELCQSNQEFARKWGANRKELFVSMMKALESYSKASERTFSMNWKDFRMKVAKHFNRCHFLP